MKHRNILSEKYHITYIKFRFYLPIKRINAKHIMIGPNPCTKILKILSQHFLERKFRTKKSNLLFHVNEVLETPLREEDDGKGYMEDDEEDDEEEGEEFMVLCFFVQYDTNTTQPTLKHD